jgi:hypothetical protein
MFRRRPPNGLLNDQRPELTAAIGATVVDDVDILNARLDDADEAAIVLPDQGDVLDAQLRAARLSADMNLVAIELRAELQRLRPE